MDLDKANDNNNNNNKCYKNKANATATFCAYKTWFTQKFIFNKCNNESNKKENFMKQNSSLYFIEWSAFTRRKQKARDKD